MNTILDTYVFTRLDTNRTQNTLFSQKQTWYKEMEKARQMIADGHLGNAHSLETGIDQPRFAPQEIPVAIEADPPIRDYPLSVDGRTIAVTCLSMGNPHAVHLIDTPVDAYPLHEVGPKVEHHPLFPRRVNFGVARVLARDRIEARVWERGCGETLACGTGVSAVFVAARLAGLVGDRANVLQPGGVLAVGWDGEGEVYLSGPAVDVFEGEWPE